MTAATTFVCEFAWLGEATGRVERNVAITVADGIITEVRSGAAPTADGAHRLAGLTVPGLANAHSHAFHRALRGRTHGDGGTFWTWREQMYDLAARLDPDSYRALASAVFAEMVQAGFTCVGEFHYLHHDRAGVPYGDPNAMGAALRDAAAVAGIRLTLLDTCYLHGGPGADHAALSPTQRRFSDGDADRWAARIDGLGESSTMRVGAAIHSVRAVDPASIERVAAWAAVRGAPLHAHVSEQPFENDACLAAYGRSPTAQLHQRGAFGERFTAVHATHLAPGDIDALASTRSMVCLCPTTERDLADGIGPSAALHAAGVALCIGSDSHAVIDPFEEARAIELDERLASLRRGTHAPGELLAAASRHDYTSVGWSEGGRIEPGALADLTTVSLESARLAGTEVEHAVAAVVFGATAVDVAHVMVSGEVVVRDGRHRTIDVPTALRDSIRAVWA